MPNNQAYDPRVSTVGERFAQAVGLSVAAVASGGGDPAPADAIAYDPFEREDGLSPDYPQFSWDDSLRIVSMSASGNPVIVREDGIVKNEELVGDPRDWTAFSGNNSLNFRYTIGQNQAERRWSLTQAYPEIWQSFWVRVPTNYEHQPDPEGGIRNNNKFWFMWQDAYSSSGEGSSCGMELRRESDGSSYVYSKYSSGDFTIVGSDVGQYPSFIRVPEDRGRWMKVVAHLKLETSPDANDGFFKVWRKWEGDQSYTAISDLQNLPLKKSSTVPGFAAGYCMGFANAPFAELTEFLWDEFTLSTTSLLT